MSLSSFSDSLQKEIDKRKSKPQIALYEALKNRGLKVEWEYYDKYKHIDIAILDPQLYIEIEGDNHYTDSTQILADLRRDFCSIKDGFYTFRIPNDMINYKFDLVVDAIVDLVNNKICKK